MNGMTMAAAGGIAGMLQHRAERYPAAPALCAPGRVPLRYDALWRAVEQRSADLRRRGIGRGDRVAVVLPNGPELAMVFLATACACTCAPLNPQNRIEEFEFYLSDIGAAALLVAEGVDSPARLAAAALGVPVLEARALSSEAAGLVQLIGPAIADGRRDGMNGAGDVALVLHTSGTTSRPKLVPLTGGNLCTSARNIVESLELTAADRCLNVMPLFHVHGLVAATLASLAAGGSVACTPGFYAPEFLEWLRASSATWYTAVPTMHQAIVARMASAEAAWSGGSLRFVRSSSAALPPTVASELERVFRVPVIEAYGMTEAAHQIASNPLPPRDRRPGSVGFAAGTEVAIMDEAGALLPAGASGEVVVRGANVMSGYEGNAAANERAFMHGWFRTGDQGFVDTDGYLHLTGRLKEIINRGGEKIAPREVDEVLLAHPAVAQAVTFAVPHGALGEDVGAAVVLRPDALLTERELRAFASMRLAHFKVPGTIVFLAEIPRGATGKVQRIGLAERLGIGAVTNVGQETEFLEPRSSAERALAQIWVEVLDVQRVGSGDDFFALGGDSMLATRVAARIAERFGVELPLLALFEAPVLSDLAHTVETAQAEPPAPPD